MNCLKCYGTGQWVSPVSRYGCPSRCPNCCGTGNQLDPGEQDPVEVRDLDLRVAELEATRRRNSELLVDNAVLRGLNDSLKKRVSDLETELREFAAVVSEHDCREQRARDITAVSSPSGRRRRPTGSTGQRPDGREAVRARDHGRRVLPLVDQVSRRQGGPVGGLLRRAPLVVGARGRRVVPGVHAVAPVVVQASPYEGDRMKTYRLDGMGGNMGRWFPSIEAAKEAYMLATERGAYYTNTEVPEVEFEPSTEHPEYGGECVAHVRVYEGQEMQACIWPERPQWPDPERRYHRGKDVGCAPDLRLERYGYGTDSFRCSHDKIVCKNDHDTLPYVSCESCSATWKSGEL